MAIFSKLIDGVLFKGGILAAGVIVLCLARWEILPNYVYPLSYGMTSIEVLGHIVGYGDILEDDDDPNYAQRMKEFELLRPKLEQKLQEELRLSREYEQLRLRWKDIDVLERDSYTFGKVMAAYEKKLADGIIILSPPAKGVKRQERRNRIFLPDGQRYPDIRLQFKRSVTWSTNLDFASICLSVF